MKADRNPFPPELRTMGFVPRWSIVWLQRPGTVAEHSFFVVVYSDIVADLIDWSGDRGVLLQYAYSHDIEEIIIGDLVSPVKRAIVDTQRATDFIDVELEKKIPRLLKKMSSLGNYPSYEEVEAIVSVADKLDALLHLIVEKRMGNHVIEKLIDDAQRRLRAAWLELPGDEVQITMLWNTVMLPSIEWHKHQGGAGI